jgi:Protein of unknown function (DUF3228)
MIVTRLCLTRCRSVRMTAVLAGNTFYLDNFAQRQWDDPNYSGTHISYDKTEFVRRVHEYHEVDSPLLDGYAPFCKHVFVPNFVGAKTGCIKITADNKLHIETAYEARSKDELAVLSRCDGPRLHGIVAAVLLAVPHCTSAKGQSAGISCIHYIATFVQQDICIS